MNAIRPATLLLFSDLDLQHRSLRLPDPSRVTALTESLRRHGQLTPLLVNLRADGTMVLVDGFKRLTALESLGQHEAAVRWLRLDEAQETATIVTSNRAHRGMTQLEEGWVIQWLVRTRKMTQEQVGTLLGRHKSWVCRRLKLAESLVEPVREDVRLGLVSATVGREVARLPRGNQVEVVESLGTHGLSSREAAEMIGHWLVAPDAAARQAITADPRAFVGPTVRADDRCSDPWRQLHAAMEALATSASMARRRITATSGGPLDDGRRQTIERPLRRAVVALRDILDELEAVAASWEIAINVEP